jgi:hypothetical protein
VQLAARLVHGASNNASAIESFKIVLMWRKVVFMQRKRISALILSAWKVYPENLSFSAVRSASAGERSPATASLVQ